MSKDENQKFINSLVLQLKEDTTYLSIKGWKEPNKMLYYDNGVFIEGGEEHVFNVLREKSDNISTAAMVEARKLLIAETPCDMNELDNDINYLACENGMINLMTGELEDFDPKYKATIRIPVIFDKNAICPVIDKYLNEVVYSEDVPVLEEIAGYCLYRSNKSFKRIFLLQGDNNSSKSTYQDLLMLMIGGKNKEKNITPVTIQELSNPNLKYNCALLYKKMLNSCSEIPTTPIKDTGKLKQLAHGDLFNGEVKFGNFVQFENYAKQVYASNHCIQIPDDELDKFIMTLKFVPFPHTFPHDVTFPATISTPEALSRFLNLALKGLQRLMANKEFSNHKTKEENLKMYSNLGDSVSQFAKDRIEKGGVDVFAIKDDILVEYGKYCIEKKLIPIPKHVFWAKLKVSVGYSRENDYKPFNKKLNKQTPAIRGIELLLEDKEEDTPKKETKNQDPKKEDPHPEIEVIPTIAEDYRPEDVDPRTPQEIERDEQLLKDHEEYLEKQAENKSPEDIAYEEHMWKLKKEQDEADEKQHEEALKTWKILNPEIEIPEPEE